MSGIADAVAPSHETAHPLPPSKDGALTVVPDGAATLSNKKQKKANKVTQKIKVSEGSVDVMVQHTNDDSVVSKRSAVAHDYMRDRFLRCFVKKPSRRSPLINRGYYLRMAVMTDLVTRLANVGLAAPERLAAASATASSSSRSVPQPVQVLSLGAGYDTLALRLLLDSVDVLSDAKTGTSSSSSSPSATCNFSSGEVLFVDVDFPAVLQSKAALMHAAPPRSFPPEWKLASSDADCPISSPFYSAVGVDLRTASAELLPRLHRFGPEGFTSTNFTIIYAECVMQYMPSEDAAKLVELLASTFPNAVFLAYDQVSPADSFGRVMQHSLRQKNSPLLGIQACPDGPHMTRRALASGMQRAWWANFYRVSRYVLAGAEKSRVEGLEAFDELEEWSEMCEHYGITMAATPGLWSSVADSGCAAHEAFVEYTSDGFPLKACSSAAPAATSLSTTTAAKSLPLSTPPSVFVAENSVQATLHNWPSARYGFEGWGNGGVAVEQMRNGDRLLVSFGGFAVGKQHQRVSTVYVHSLQEGELRVVVAGEDAALRGGDQNETSNLSIVPSTAATNTDALQENAPAKPPSRLPPALVFHSFTRIGAGQYLVWGGRTNPAAANSDAYLLTLEIPRTVSLGSTVRARWTRLAVAHPECSPTARYRHTMVCLRDLESGADATLLLLGGKTIDASADEKRDNKQPINTATLECYIVRVSAQAGSIAYEQLHLAGAESGVAPRSLHSAAALALSADEVVLSGGLHSHSDATSSAFWLLRLSSKTWTRLPIDLGVGRFSHSLTRVTVDNRDCFLLLGGSTCEEKSNVPAALLIPAEAVKAADAAQPAVAVVSLPKDAPWWSRHSCVALGSGVVGVVGGGYTCFSFGTFASKPQLLHLGDSVDEGAWRGVSGTLASTTATGSGDIRKGCAQSRGARPVYAYDELLSKPWPAVREVTTYDPAAFLAAACAASAPVVFRNTPLGACVARWSSPAYLKKAEGEAVVSVHVAERSQLLDFVRKNFAFRHVTLAELVQHVEDATRLYRETKETPAETWYYRSIAAHMKSERSNLWTDFAELGKDFVLPPGAKEFIKPRLHQSCLRMNAPPLQLWTHFDTLDNVLCQIVGCKRVVLFPPSEYNNLYISGSSSAVINLDAPDLVRYPRFIEACKSAQEVILRPGDMLFFPAMWFHHITTLEEEDENNGESRSEGHEPDGATSFSQPPYNISVNVFYRHFEDASVYDTKDLYGNKDILAVTRLRGELQSAARTLLSRASLNGGEGKDAPTDASQTIPSEYAEFALRQFLQDVEGIAADMSNARRAAAADAQGRP